MTTTNTKPVTWKGSIGTKVLTTYVDPYPGKDNSDRVTFTEQCDRCGGTGIFKWWTHMGQAGGTCFKCFGTAKYSYELAVITLRKRAKEDAYQAENKAEIQAYWAERNAAEEAAAKAAEFAKNWDEAHKEQARRAAMNNGTIGTVGERIRDIAATVEVSASFERNSYAGYGTELVKIIIAKIEDGRVIKMMGTANALFGLNRGDKVTITGTVKGYGEYKGQTQTILQRPKIEVVEEAQDDK